MNIKKRARKRKKKMKSWKNECEVNDERKGIKMKREK